jgi:hypothetical protein
MKDVATEEVIAMSLAVPERLDDGGERGACVARVSSGASERSFTAHQILAPDVMMPAQFFASRKKTAHVDQGIQRLMLAVLEVAIADWQGAVGSLAGRKLRHGRDADDWIFASFHHSSKSFTDGRTTRAARRTRPSEASESSSEAIKKRARAGRDGVQRAGVLLLPVENPFSFENVCTALGIEADYLRGGLRRWHAAFVGDYGTTGIRVTRGSSEGNENSSTVSEKTQRAPVLGFAHGHANQVRATSQLTPKPEGSRNRQGGRFRAGAEF